MDAIQDFEIKIEEPDTDIWTLSSRPIRPPIRPIQDYQFNVQRPLFSTRRMPNFTNGYMESHPPMGPFNFLENNPVPQLVLLPQNLHTETLTLPMLRGSIAPEPLPLRYRPPETREPLVSLILERENQGLGEISRFSHMDFYFCMIFRLYWNFLCNHIVLMRLKKSCCKAFWQSFFPRDCAKAFLRFLNCSVIWLNMMEFSSNWRKCNWFLKVAIFSSSWRNFNTVWQKNSVFCCKSSILFNYRYLSNNLKILGSNGFVTSKPQGMKWLPRDVWKLLHPVQKSCNDITYFYFLTVSKIVTGSIGWCCYFARIPACSTTRSSCSDDTFSYSIGKPNAIYTFTARKPQDNWQHPLHDWWRWHCGIWSRRAKIETQTKG